VNENSKYYNSPKLYSDTGFNEASDANEFMSGLDNAIYITEIDRHIEKKNAPLLFNLAELQNECSKKLHLSSKETLNVAQSLYEKKLTTYPRTDARVLSTAISLEISKNVMGLKNGIYAKYAEVAEKNNCSLRGKYVDDSKITDHYAIIPTGKQPDQELTSAERQVYDLIVRRFLAIFYPAAEFDMVKFTGVCSGEHFVGSQKVLVKKGFLEIYSSSDGKDDDLLTDVAFPLKKDTAYEVNWDIKNGETKPPSRYTSGSIILAMENAGNLIEDEQLREQIKGAGVGTSATRADIIEKLISLDYISLNKMKQTITPTNFGEMIFEVLNAELPEMLSPQITAEWEQKLDNIANGSLSADDFKQEIFTYVRDKCNHIKETYVNNIPSVKDKIKPYATSAIRTEYKPFENWNTKLVCPLCGSEVETTAWGFKCKNNISKTEGCTFSVNGDILNHRLLTNELGELLKDGRSGPFYDFISPKGKPFAAFLLWNKDNKIEFDFTEMPWEKTELKCPVCGKDIVKRGNIYKCEGYIDRDNGCKFFIGKICGKSLNDKQIGNLVNNGTTDLITGFKNKEGDSFNAFLELDADKKIVFRFPTADDLKTDMKCPLCGGAIVATRFGFVCEKYKKKELRTDADCSFVAGTIFEHTVKEAELKKILSGGSTNFLQFKKDGKDFFARLYWDRVEKRIAFQFQDELDVKCPVCGKGLVKNKYGYCCSGRSAGCQFHVGAVSGILINEEQLKKLITTGKTDLIAGFKPKDKNKKPFSAYLMWNKDDGLSFDFDGADNGVSSYTTEYVCPVCHKEKIKEGKGSYYCSCGFKMFKNMSSVDIPVEQVNKLFTYGRTDVISGFFSPKKRKMFSVRLAIDDGKVVFSFLDTGNKHVIKEVGENVSE
jgi:DNA topoisomerase-3